jgi:hypothetical protein
MMVYEVLTPKVSEGDVRRLMNAFRLDGEVVDRKRQYVVKDGERVLEMFKQPGTGYMRFSDNAKLAAEKAAENLPPEDVAIGQAETFLKKLDLLPGNASFSGVGYYEFQRADGKGNVMSEGKSALSVAFAFEVGGLPVLGPGAKASVVFGAGGEIIGAAKIWREIAADEEVEILRPEEAFEGFKKGWPPEQVAGMPNIRTLVRIDEVEMAYYAGPGLLPQERLEPVYVFYGSHETEGTVGDSGIHEKEHFRILIPAVPGGETRVQSTWGPGMIR